MSFLPIDTSKEPGFYLIDQLLQNGSTFCSSVTICFLSHISRLFWQDDKGFFFQIDCVVLSWDMFFQMTHLKSVWWNSQANRYDKWNRGSGQWQNQLFRGQRSSWAASCHAIHHF